MTTSDLLRSLFRQMEWADALVWSTVLEHPALVEDSILRDRAYHIHLVQRAFLHIWRGESMDFAGTDTLKGTNLAKWARAYHESVAPFMGELSDSQLESTVHLPWASHVMERLGTGVSTPSFGETLVQVTSHSAYHRGQVNTRIREIGVAPPLTDFIAWVWSGKPAPSWPTQTA